MATHLQRRPVRSIEEAQSLIAKLDLSCFHDPHDVLVAVEVDVHFKWVTVIQETALPLTDVQILPGFHAHDLSPGRGASHALH